jgi:hypothetical protein
MVLFMQHFQNLRTKRRIYKIKKNKGAIERIILLGQKEFCETNPQ